MSIIERATAHPENRIPKPILMLSAGVVIVFFWTGGVFWGAPADSGAYTFGYVVNSIVVLSVYYVMSGRFRNPWKRWRKK